MPVAWFVVLRLRMRLHAFLLPLVLLPVIGCGGDAATDDPAARALPASGGKADGTSVGGDPIPPEDENLRYIAEHGFGAIAFAATCVSKAEGGETLTGEALPVGGGRVIECTTHGSLETGTMGLLSDASETWCALGRVASAKAGGDPRVQVQITARPADAAWTLVATREGEPIELAQVTAFGVAKVWPIWVDLAYTTVSLKRDAGADCRDVFGP